jgi:hypothetical protein
LPTDSERLARVHTHATGPYVKQRWSFSDLFVEPDPVKEIDLINSKAAPAKPSFVPKPTKELNAVKEKGKKNVSTKTREPKLEHKKEPQSTPDENKDLSNRSGLSDENIVLLQKSKNLILSLRELCEAHQDPQSLSYWIFKSHSCLNELKQDINILLKARVPKEVLDFEESCNSVKNFVIMHDHQDQKSFERLAQLVSTRRGTAELMTADVSSHFQNKMALQYGKAEENMRIASSSLQLLFEILNRRNVLANVDLSIDKERVETFDTIPWVKQTEVFDLVRLRNDVVNQFRFLADLVLELPLNMEKLAEIESSTSVAYPDIKVISKLLDDLRLKTGKLEDRVAVCFNRIAAFWFSMDHELSELMKSMQGNIPLHIISLKNAVASHEKLAASVLEFMRTNSDLEETTTRRRWRMWK